MAHRYPTYAEWFEGLSEADKKRTSVLLTHFKATDACRPEEWVRSEVSEGIPQLATYLLLHDVWAHIDDAVNEADMWIGDVLHPTALPNLPLFTDAAKSIRRMQESGVVLAEIAAVARLAAYNTEWGLVQSLDRERAFESSDEAPGWRLMETNAEGEITGRDLRGLHESLLSFEEDRNATGENRE